MSIKNRIQQISQENDTVFSGHALLDSEILLNGHYHYSVQLKHNSSLVPLVKVSAADTRLKYPINLVPVTLQKINGSYLISNQSSSAGLVGGGSSTNSLNSPNPNGSSFTGFTEEEERVIYERSIYAEREAGAALARLDVEIERIDDAAVVLRNDVTANINQTKANLEQGISVIAGDLATAQTQINAATSTISTLADPGSAVRNAVTAEIALNKTAIEATNSVLGTRINTANTEITNAKARITAVETNVTNIVDPGSALRQTITSEIAANKALIEANNSPLGTRINAVDADLVAAKARVTAAESAITTINDPAGMLRQEIVSKIATAKSQIEAQGSVLDARFDADIATVDSKVTTINTVTIPQVNTNITNTVNTAKSDLTTLMDTKDGTLKTTIESTAGVLSTRIDSKDAALKTTIESGTGVLANLMDTKNTALKNVIEAGGSALNTRINNERDALIAQYGTETVNLISNGNANNGSVLGWQSGITALLATTAEVPAGAPSRYVFKTGNGKTWMNKPKAVTGGSTFKASYWVATTTTTDNTSFGLTLQMLKKDGTYSFTGVGGNITPAAALNTWVQVTGQYTVPADVIEITAYFEYKATVPNYAAVPWYFTNAELRNITESEPIRLRADQLYTDMYTAVTGVKDRATLAAIDITNLTNNKASVTSVTDLTNVVNGQGGRITTTEGILTTNGINGSSNIAGRVTTIESDLNTPSTGVKARITTVESTKADTTALTAATNRVTALESGVTNSGVALVPPAFDDNWRLYIGNSPTGVNPGNSTLPGTQVSEPDTLRGKAFRYTMSIPHFYQKQYVKITADKTYRVSFRFKPNNLTTDNKFTVEARAYQLDNTFGYFTTAYIELGIATVTTAGQWYTFSYTIGKDAVKKFSGGSVYARFALVGNYNRGSSDTTTQLDGTYDYFLVEDISDVAASNSRITTVETTLNDPTSGVVKRLDNLTTTVSNNNTTLTGSINSLSTSKADLSALTAANTKIQTLENELNTSANGAANIKARLGTVETTVTTTNSAYATRLNNLESNYTTVTGKINAVDGVNKWRYIEYPRGSFAQQYPPTLVEWGKVIGTPSVSKLVDHSDGLFLSTSNADVIVRGTTAVYVAVAKTINFTISADDGVRVYVNGESLFFRAAYAAGQTSTITANLRAGWNTIDISFGNGTGPGNAGNITPFLSTMVDYISLSEAIDYAPISTANAAITDEATTRANADSAAATRITNLETSVNTGGTGLLARMTNAENTKVDNTTFTAATNRISTLESESVKDLKIFDGTFTKDLDTWATGLNGLSIPSNSTALQLATITEGKVLQASTDFYSKGYIPVNPYRKYKVTIRYKFTNLGTGAANAPIIYVLVASLDQNLNNIVPVPAGGSYTYGSVKNKSQVVVDNWYEDSFIISDVDAGSTSDKFRPGVAYAKFGMLVREGAIVQVQYILVEDATSVEQTNARITNVESTLTSADSAMAGRLNTIETSINTGGNSLDNLRTAISDEVTSRTTADTTLGGRIDTLTSTVNTNKTTIEARALNIETTKANLTALNAEAARINSLEVAVSNKDNLVKNQAFETDTSFWSAFYPAQTTRLAYNAAGVPTGAPTPFVMKTSGRDTANSPNWINATAGDTFYVSMWCANTATTANTLNFMLHGMTLDNLSTYVTAASRSFSDAVGTWKKVEGIYTVPAGVHKFRIFLQQDRVASNTDNDNAWYVANIELRQTNTLKASNAKITNLENVVINGGSSLVSKVSALETTVNVTGGGLTARLDTLNQIVTNGTTGVVTKLDNLTTETRNNILNLTDNSGFANGLFGWSEQPDGSNTGVITGSSIVDGKFRISRAAWLYGRLIPVNTARTYRIRFKTRVVTNGTNTAEQKVYAGVATYDAAKVLQTVSPGTHRYCAVIAANVLAADGWRTYEGIITGEGNTTHNQFRAGTAYVRPMAIVNYNGGNAVAEVEYLQFEDITDIVTTNATVTNLAQTVTNADTALSNRLGVLETSGANSVVNLRGSITTLESSKADLTKLTSEVNRVTNLLANTKLETKQNSWLHTRYTYTANIPYPADFQNMNLISSSFVLDGATIVQNVADNYIGRIQTNVYVEAAKTVNLTFSHDDGARLIINGVEVYAYGFVRANNAVSFTLNTGWNSVEFIWQEGGGGDGIYAVTPTLSSQVKYLAYNGSDNLSIAKDEVTARTSLTDSLASRATALESSITNGTTGLAALKGSITNLENTRATNTEVSNISSRVSTVEGSINHGTTGLTALKNSITTLETNKADFAALTSEANRITALNARVGVDASNLVGNPSADRGAEGWVNVYTRTDSVAPTPNTFATSSRDVIYEPSNYRISVTPGERYYFSMWTGAPVNHGIAISIGYRGHDKDGNTISFMPAVRRESNDATGSWKQSSGYLTIPSGVAYIVPWVQLDYTGSNATWFFTKVEVRSVSQNKEVDAKITTLETTVATSTGALATRATNLEAALTTGSGITNYAKLNEISSVSVDAQGKANAIRGVELDVNGRISGYRSVNNGVSSSFTVTADTFKVFTPGQPDTAVFAVGTVNGVTKLGLRGDMIVDGAITANKLTIGNGVNLVPNSAFVADLTHPPVNSHPDSFWRFYNYNGALTGLRSDWAPYGKRSIYIEDSVATAANADRATLFSKPIPIDPEKYYAFTVLLNKHRADASTAFIYWTDSSDNNSVAYYGNVISNNYTSIRRTVSRAGPVGAIVYDEHFVAAKPPANARYARLIIQKGNRNAGEANSYVFATEIMFEASNNPITEPSPWSEGSYTTIDGGMIQTGFISANRIAADTINANHITSNAITVDKLAANSVTTDKIQANAINAGKIVAGAITTTHMTAGTINADRLVARSITADRIATGSITAGEIQAGTITAGLIAAGAITTDKLSVGSGRNLLSNSEFLNRLTTNWNARTLNTSNASFTPSEFSGLTTSDEFTIYTHGGAGMYIRSTRTDNGRIEFNSELIPVKAGETYIASAYISGHRLHHQICLVWYNSSSAYFSEHANTKTLGAGETSNIPRPFIRQVAPVGAAFVRIYIRGWTDITGPNTDPYLFISKPMLEAAIPGQLLPGIYSNGSSTLIDAGKIVTGLVSANVVDAEMIRAKIISATRINASDIIASNSITAAQVNTANVRLSMFNGDGKLVETDIRPGEIRTNLIATDAIVSRHIQTDTIETRMLKAGAITTDKLSVGSGVNMLFNSAFRYDTRGWNFGGSGSHSITTRSDFTLPGVPALELKPSNGLTNVSGRYADSNTFDIVPGDYYYVSAYVSSHRITPQLTVIYFNNTTMVGAYNYKGPTPNTGGNVPSSQTRIGGLSQAPNNANKMTIRLESHNYSEASATLIDSYMWWNRIMVERSQAGATSPSVYVESGSTMIDGGSIQTGLIASNVVDAEMIRTKVIDASNINAADIIATGSITANELSANSVTAAKILAGSITADKIEALAIKSTHIDTNTIEARMIKAGAISADKLAVGSGNMITNSTLEFPVSTVDVYNGYEWAYFNYNYTQVVMDNYSAFIDREAMLMLQEGDGMFSRPNATQQTADVATVFSTRIPVVAGKWYNFSVVVHSEQCNTSPTLRFTNETDNGSIYHGGTLNSVAPTLYDYQTFQIKRDYVDTTPLTMERRFISVQAPAGSKYIRVLLSKGPRTAGTYSVARFTNLMLTQSDVQLTIPPTWARSGSTLIDGSSIKTGFINANRLQAEDIRAKLISASKIQATDIIAPGSITTTQLNASAINLSSFDKNGFLVGRTNITPGAINTTLLEANAVEAVNIKAGAVTVDKLSVGKGRNLMPNSNFSGGFNDGWRWITGPFTSDTALAGGPLAGNAVITTKNSDPDWNFGTTILRLLFPLGTKPEAWFYFDAPRVYVSAGKYYIFQLKIASHRVATRVEINFFNASNISILRQDILPPQTASLGGRVAADWANPWLKLQAPIGASYATMRIVSYGYTESAVEPYGTAPVVWCTEFMVEEVHATATEPSAYSQDNSTLIDGGLIRTNTINANSIIASTLQVTNANIVEQISASKLAIFNNNGNGKIDATLIDKDGIFTTGNVISQAGFYVLKPNSTDSPVTSDTDSRIAFGVNASGNAVFQGDVVANNFKGNNSLLRNNTVADRYLIARQQGVPLTQAEIDSGSYDIVSYLSYNYFSDIGSGSYMQFGSLFLNVNFSINPSYKKQYFKGEIQFNVTTGGSGFYLIGMKAIPSAGITLSVTKSTAAVAGTSVYTTATFPITGVIQPNQTSFEIALELETYFGQGFTYGGLVSASGIKYTA